MRPVLKIMLALLICILIGCQSYDQQEDAAVQRWNKTSAEIKLKVAKESFEHHRYDQAKKHLLESLDLDDQQSQAYLLAGQIEMAEGDKTQAADYLLKAIELDKDIDQAWFLLGYIAEENTEHEKASQCYLEAYRLDKTNIKYVLSVARVYISMGDFQSARDFLERNMHANSGDASIKLTVANLNMQMGDYDSAIKYYRQAVLTGDGDKTILESLGYCYIASNRWEKAAEVFEELAASSIGESAQEYMDIFAVCSMNSGNYNKAAKAFDKVSAENRENPQFWVKLGQARLGSNSGIAALACANRALRLDPEMVDAMNLQTAALYLMKDYRGCIKSAEKIINSHKDCSFAWMMAGRSYEKLGSREKARQAYQESLKLRPDNEQVMKLANNL